MCWYHEAHCILGRTIRLNRRGHNLDATCRFLKSSRTQKVMNVVNTLTHPRADPTSWSASLGFVYGIGLNTRVDRETRTITVTGARLIEWSVCGNGADPGAKALGPVVLRLQG